MKKSSVLFIVLAMVIVTVLTGCSNSHQPKVVETPIGVVVNDGGALCLNDTMITYRTYEKLDAYDCTKDGLIVSGSQNLKALVTVSNFSPVKGETVTVTYSFKKDESIVLDDCEISADAGLHTRVSDGKFTIMATGTTSTYTLRCVVDKKPTIEAEFTLRAPAFGG